MIFDKSCLPQFNELLIPIIVALKELGGYGSNKEINNKLIEILNITPDVAEIPHNSSDSRTELEYRAAWGRTYLKKAGYIDNPFRSSWKLVVDVDPEEIDPQLIVESVRAEATKMTEELDSLEISKIEAAQVFESYIVRTLQEYINYQDKNSLEARKNNSADFFFSEGIADIEKPVYVEIKYGTYPHIIQIIKGYCHRATNWIDKKNEHILFITNEKIVEKPRFIRSIKNEFGIDVSIWDIEELARKIPTFPTNLDYLSNPRAAIVESVINNDNKERLSLDNEEKIIALREAYKNEKVVLFLGAGVSIDAGVPLWDELINRLLLRMLNLKIQDSSDDNDVLNTPKFTEEDIEIISKLALKNKEDTPLMQMRYIRTALSTDMYYSAVHKELYADKININTKLLDMLSKISTPRRQHKGLESIVTYNFDNLMEQSLEKWGVEYNVIQTDKMPVTDKLNIYHVHGYLPQNANNAEERTELIFSEEDYHRVYGDAYCWSNMAQVKAFQDNVCLFVGCSLTDPNLRRLLDNAMRQPKELRHFAILKRKSFELENETKQQEDLINWYQEIDDAIRDQIFKSFGISVIWVNDYKEIPNILNRLLSTTE